MSEQSLKDKTIKGTMWTSDNGLAIEYPEYE